MGLTKTLVATIAAYILFAPLGDVSTFSLPPGSSWKPTTDFLEDFIEEASSLLSRYGASADTSGLALFLLWKFKRASPSESDLWLWATIALALAYKYLNDKTLDLHDWADISGTTVRELRTAEVKFLKAIRYELTIPEEDFSNFVAKIENLNRQVEERVLLDSEVPDSPSHF